MMFKTRAGHHSLYWRIAIGFIVCIAAVLAIQGAVVLLLLNRQDPDARTFFTSHVSEDVAAALEQNPSLDVQAFVKSHYPTFPRSFYVVMASGDAFYFGDKRPAPGAVPAVIEELRNSAVQEIPSYWQRSPYWATAIVANGKLQGLVSVVARDTYRDLWRPMAFLAIGLVVVGTVLSSWFIFGPAHHRLESLEATARRLGDGDTDARAEEAGGDEVASLARTFNVMAQGLAARSAEIAEYDQTRRLLLADISHELMTPLTAIRGYQEKLAADPAISSAPHCRRYVSIIGEEALRVERIVRDLLDLAKFENKGEALDIQDVSIEGLFGRVAARQDAEASRRGVKLATAIDFGAEIVRGDPFRLEQALQNLAANALRHVPHDGTVELHARLSRAEIVITVRDTGAGISAEHLPFIFNRFYKVDASRAAVLEGSGLGLSIVKAIIEHHGGSISVTSQPHVETIFTIRLPASTDVALLDRSA